MSEVRTTVHRRNDLPCGLPAIWDLAGDHLAIYLRDDLPHGLVGHLIDLAHRDALSAAAA